MVQLEEWNNSDCDSRLQLHPHTFAPATSRLLIDVDLRFTVNTCDATIPVCGAGGAVQYHAIHEPNANTSSVHLLKKTSFIITIPYCAIRLHTQYAGLPAFNKTGAPKHA